MASNKSKDKGTRAETALKKLLIAKTGLNWQRTPSSGALSEEHKLKGDLYIPQEKNIYTIEVKHYKDCHINHLLLSGANPQIHEWWKQTEREADQNGNEALLIFKHDRSKWYMATYQLPMELPSYTNRYIYLGYIDIYILLLEDWLTYDPEFIK